MKIVGGAANERDFIGLGRGTEPGFLQTGEDKGVNGSLDPDFVSQIDNHGRDNFFARNEGPIVALSFRVSAERRDLFRVLWVLLLRRPNRGSEQRSRA